MGATEPSPAPECLLDVFCFAISPGREVTVRHSLVGGCHCWCSVVLLLFDDAGQPQDKACPNTPDCAKIKALEALAIAGQQMTVYALDQQHPLATRMYVTWCTQTRYPMLEP